MDNLTIGTKVVVNTAIWHHREAIITRSRWDDDGDRIYIVTIVPTAEGMGEGGNRNWVVRPDQIVSLVADKDVTFDDLSDDDKRFAADGWLGDAQG